MRIARPRDRARGVVSLLRANERQLELPDRGEQRFGLPPGVKGEAGEGRGQVMNHEWGDSPIHDS